MPRLAAASRLVLCGGLAFALDGSARPAAPAILEYRIWLAESGVERLGRLDVPASR